MAQTLTDEQFRKAAKRAARQEKKVQKQVDRKEARSFKPKEDDGGAMQAGARPMPESPPVIRATLSFSLPEPL